MRTYINFKSAGHQNALEHAGRGDDPEKLRRLRQTHEGADEAWRSWALGCGGSVVSLGDGAGVLEVPADRLTELEGLRSKYGGALGHGVAVGVGLKLGEADTARRVAEKLGGDRVMLYRKGIEDKLEDKQNDAQDPLRRIIANEAAGQEGAVKELAKTDYPGMARLGTEQAVDQRNRTLDKSEQSGSGVAPAAAPKMQARDANETAAAAASIDTSSLPPPPEATHASADLEEQFHALAGMQQQRDTQQAQGGDVQQLKQQVAKVLEMVRGQGPVLAQIKGKAPDTFNAVMALVQSVISLGRALAPQQGQPVQKSEALRKGEPDLFGGIGSKAWNDRTTGVSGAIEPGMRVTLHSQEGDRPGTIRRVHELPLPGNRLTPARVYGVHATDEATGYEHFFVRIARGGSLGHTWAEPVEGWPHGDDDNIEEVLGHARDAERSQGVVGETATSSGSYFDRFGARPFTNRRLDFAPHTPSDTEAGDEDLTRKSLAKAEGDDDFEARQRGDSGTIRPGQYVTLHHGAYGPKGIDREGVGKSLGRIERVHEYQPAWRPPNSWGQPTAPASPRAFAVHVVDQATGNQYDFVRHAKSRDWNSPDWWMAVTQMPKPDATGEWVRHSDEMSEQTVSQDMMGMPAGSRIRSEQDQRDNDRLWSSAVHGGWLGMVGSRGPGGNQSSRPQVAISLLHTPYIPSDDENIKKAELAKAWNLGRFPKDDQEHQELDAYDRRQQGLPDPVNHPGSEIAVGQRVTLRGSRHRPLTGVTSSVQQWLAHDQLRPGTITRVMSHPDGRVWGVEAQDEGPDTMEHAQFPTRRFVRIPKGLRGNERVPQSDDPYDYEWLDHPGSWEDAHGLHQRSMETAHASVDGKPSNIEGFVGGVWGSRELLHVPFEATDRDVMKAGLDPNKPPKAPNTHTLPVGTVKDSGSGIRDEAGKVKVKHGDGSTSWIAARAGQVTAVADRHAPPNVGTVSHPLSSRNQAGH